jgi:hypothetical protein
LQKFEDFLSRLQIGDQKIEVENCQLTKSSGWVDVKAVLWIAYSNQKVGRPVITLCALLLYISYMRQSNP